MSKIVSTKINAGFLAIVLIVGTFVAISPSFMIGAHAQQYEMDQKYNSYEPDYGMDSYDDKKSYAKDNSYKSKDDNSVSIKKIKCNNINVNVNGFNGVKVGTLPTALNGLATEAQASDEDEIGASSLGTGVGSDGGRPSGSDSDSRFVCIDNNDFTVVEEEPTTTILKVTKEIDCEDQTEGDDCDDLRELVNENEYIIQVEGNNPDPSSPFPGSPTGTDVTLGPGDYVVSETSGETLNEDIQTFADKHPDRASLFSHHRLQEIVLKPSLSEATGTIATGESQTCNVINAFSIITFTPPLTPYK